MKEITKVLIKEFNIKQLGYDFMGYTLQKNDIYTFHHLIIPNRYGGKETKENGSVLCGKSSHPYLHLIEEKDYEMFYYITREMIDINMKGCLDMYNLRKINNVLCQFEREHSGDTTRKGRALIKEEYTRRMLKR